MGAPPEAYLEWADTSPVPLSAVAEELGMLSAAPEVAEASQELAAVGAEQGERAGTPLFFRKPEQQPVALRGNARSLQSQQILAAGMLRPGHLLDLIRNFTVFQQVDGKTRKVVARYQQFRAVHKAIARLVERAFSISADLIGWRLSPSRRCRLDLNVGGSGCAVTQRNLLLITFAVGTSMPARTGSRGELRFSPERLVRYRPGLTSGISGFVGARAVRMV